MILDPLDEITEVPTFVNLEDYDGIQEDSNPLNILCSLEQHNDWNFQPLEVLMAQAVPVTY